MSHQPFEAWILDSEVLSSEERRALQEHLTSCKQCQQIERKWLAVHQQLRARPMVAPAPGFTQRWQSSLAERRAREQRKQAWKIFGVLLTAAIFILVLLAGYVISTSTPTAWLTAVTRTISSSEVFFQWVVYVVQGWLSSTPLALNIAIWIYLTLTLCGLSLMWLAVLWRTKSVGVLNNEMD